MRIGSEGEQRLSFLLLLLLRVSSLVLSPQSHKAAVIHLFSRTWHRGVELPPPFSYRDRSPRAAHDRQEKIRWLPLNASGDGTELRHCLFADFRKRQLVFASRLLAAPAIRGVPFFNAITASTQKFQSHFNVFRISVIAITAAAVIRCQSLHGASKVPSPAAPTATGPLVGAASD